MPMEVARGWDRKKRNLLFTRMLLIHAEAEQYIYIYIQVYSVGLHINYPRATASKCYKWYEAFKKQQDTRYRQNMHTKSHWRNWIWKKQHNFRVCIFLASSHVKLYPTMCVTSKRCVDAKYLLFFFFHLYGFLSILCEWQIFYCPNQINKCESLIIIHAQIMYWFAENKSSAH